MKTTVDSADALLDKAKQTAAEEGTTLRELMEDGLRCVLAQRQHRKAFKLRDASFGGEGLQSHLREGNWEQIRDLVFEGRGA